MFTDEYGQPIPVDNFTKAFRLVADAAGLPPSLTLHSLRHSFASWSLRNGSDMVAVSASLGHSKVSTTLDIYGHAVPGARERAAKETVTFLRRALAGKAPN